MSLIIRLITASVMFSLFLFGMANFARIHPGIDYSQALEDIQESFLPLLENPDFFPPNFEYATQAPLGYVEFPMPSAAGPENLRLF